MNFILMKHLLYTLNVMKILKILLDNLKTHEHHCGICIKETVFIKKILKDNINKIFKEQFKHFL